MNEMHLSPTRERLTRRRRWRPIVVDEPTPAHLVGLASAFLVTGVAIALLAVVAMAALPLLVGAGAALVLWRSLRGQRRIDGAPSMRPDAPNGASASSMRRRAAAGFGDSTVIAQRRE